VFAIIPATILKMPLHMDCFHCVYQILQTNYHHFGMLLLMMFLRVQSLHLSPTLKHGKVTFSHRALKMKMLSVRLGLTAKLLCLLALPTKYRLQDPILLRD
jgi:hypothetical protein